MTVSSCDHKLFNFRVDMSYSCYGHCVTLKSNFSAQLLYSVCLQRAIKDGNTAARAHGNFFLF